eukprot:TRINITY_DN18211_c0_g1_i2.p1 TRINITY_DN18211_c0_g1~~TRINITY_DN18211_c0_g1_i2.p1  ORF type:complete len:395 (-),score=39.43 TRINITY_DN18211_c0_g1_i2:126-1310(-)
MAAARPHLSMASAQQAPPPIFASAGGVVRTSTGSVTHTPRSPARPPHYSPWEASGPPPPLFSPAPVPVKERSSVPISDMFLRQEVLGLLMGLLTCFCMTLLPVFGGVALLLDPNYKYWQGSSYPLLSIGIAVGIFFVAAMTSYLLYRRARRHDLNEATMALAASIFSAMLGVALLVVALKASMGLKATAQSLMHGCSSSNHEVAVLNDYSLVLANIRAQPECVAEASVEMCKGYSENQYTAYLKYLEQEFQCGPICGTPATASFHHERWGTGLVQANTEHTEEQQDAMSRSLRMRKNWPSGGPYRQEHVLMPDGAKAPDAVAEAVVTTSAKPEIAKPEVKPYWEVYRGPAGREAPGAASGEALKLFGHGYTRALCLPLIATRLEVRACRHQPHH